MLKNITLGQYYPGDSIIHRMDPRVKLLATLVYIICVFLFQGLIGWILLTAILIFLTKLSGVPFRMMAKGVRALWPLLAITAFFNLFFTQGEDLWRVGVIHITDAGLHQAIFYALRLVYLIMGSSVMTLTTSPNKLTDGLEKGLSWLSRIGVPVHEIALMMSIALRFIPILGEEAEKIKKAQLARGADFDEGNVIRRALALIPILVPLFVSAFGRAQDLSQAMDARCYHGGEGRTKLHPLVYEKRDRIGYLLIAVMLVVFILLRIRDFPLPF